MSPTGRVLLFSVLSGWGSPSFSHHRREVCASFCEAFKAWSDSANAIASRAVVRVMSKAPYGRTFEEAYENDINLPEFMLDDLR